MLLNIRATFTNNFVPKNFQKSSIWSHCGHSSRLHLPSNPHTLSISLVLVSVKVNEERMLLVACSMDVVETWCLSRESPSSPSLSLLHPPTLSLSLSFSHTHTPLLSCRPCNFCASDKTGWACVWVCGVLRTLYTHRKKGIPLSLKIQEGFVPSMV